MILTQPDAFAITLLIEAPVAALMAHWLNAKRTGAAVAAATSSAVTHPFVWQASLAFFDAPPLLPEAISELCAMIVEAAFYRAFATARWRDAALLSVTANAASWALGALLQS